MTNTLGFWIVMLLLAAALSALALRGLLRTYDREIDRLRGE